MLWIPNSELQGSQSNQGATYTDAGLGANVPGHANANTKGANTGLLGGVIDDCYGLGIMFCGGNTSATIRRQMVDILIDPAAGVGNAGSTWSVLIANLYANSPAFAAGASCYRYYFPIFLKAGTAIGAAHQDLAAGTTALRVIIRTNTRPSRAEAAKVGTRVQTLGATTASTSGVAVTPGTGAMGSYSASLGTLDRDSWWFQLGVGSNDTSMTANGYLFDLAANATNKLMLIEKMGYGVVGAAEQAWKDACGMRHPIRSVQSGENIYARAAGAGAPDTSMDVVAYAVSG